MNRIDNLFATKSKNILSIYFTAGFPTINDTIPILESLQNAGVDMVEIGMPFSDPLADGPVIQQSSHIALQNGMSIKTLFEQLKNVRKTIQIPLLLMGYLNPVLIYGFERFLKDAKELGIDGLIIPDMPLNIYKEEYIQLFAKYNMHNIFLITPQTTEDRLQEIVNTSSGFIYMVSSASTTGAKQQIENKQEDYFKRIEALNLKTPRIIGFGISSAETFKKACSYANGAIIGSAFIQLLEKNGNQRNNISDFIKSIRS